MTGSHRDEVGMVSRWIWRAAGAGFPLLVATMVPSAGFAGVMGIDDGDEIVVAAQALPDSALEGRRGGFRVGQFDVDVGVAIETWHNGVRQFVSRLTIFERVGNTLHGQITRMTPGTETVSSNPTATMVIETATSGGATITHDFTNGVNAIISNVFNNATAEQKIKIDATVNNFQSLSRAAQRSTLASRLAAQSAAFRPSR